MGQNFDFRLGGSVEGGRRTVSTTAVVGISAVAMAQADRS